MNRIFKSVLFFDRVRYICAFLINWLQEHCEGLWQLSASCGRKQTIEKIQLNVYDFVKLRNPQTVTNIKRRLKHNDKLFAAAAIEIRKSFYSTVFTKRQLFSSVKRVSKTVWQWQWWWQNRIQHRLNAIAGVSPLLHILQLFNAVWIALAIHLISVPAGERSAYKLYSWFANRRRSSTRNPLNNIEAESFSSFQWSVAWPDMQHGVEGDGQWWLQSQD